MSLPDCTVYILYLSIVQNGFTADLYNVSIPRSEKPSHGDRLPPNTNTNTKSVRTVSVPCLRGVSGRSAEVFIADICRRDRDTNAARVMRRTRRTSADRCATLADRRVSGARCSTYVPPYLARRHIQKSSGPPCSFIYPVRRHII